MVPGLWRKLSATALLALALLLPAGCGSEEGAEFTNENFGELVADPAAHDGATVNVVGQVALVERDDEAVYLYLFADPEAQTWPLVVSVPEPELEVAEGEEMRVTGTVEQSLELPESMSGFTEEPLVLASSVAPVVAGSD